MATSLFQPFFTLDSVLLRKHAKLLSRYLFLFIFGISLFLLTQNYSNGYNSILIMKFLSIVYFVLALISFKKYRQYVT